MKNFVYREIKSSLILSILITLMLYLLFGFKVMSSFFIGYIIGCVNFLLLSYGLNFLISSVRKYAQGVHFLTFAIRYSAIGTAFYELVKHKNANVFALAFGVIIINISFVLDAFKKCPSF